MTLRLLRAVSPETAAEADVEVEVEDEEALPSHGASATDALKTREEGFPTPVPPGNARLSTATFKLNSALLCPAGLRQPWENIGSREKAGPGKPAPQGQVRGSRASDEEGEEQV